MSDHIRNVENLAVWNSAITVMDRLDVSPKRNRIRNLPSAQIRGAEPHQILSIEQFKFKYFMIAYSFNCYFSTLK